MQNVNDAFYNPQLAHVFLLDAQVALLACKLIIRL